MFNKEINKSNVKKTETIIGKSIKVKGNFHGQGNIIIDGEVEGDIKTDGDLFAGENSVILANIIAKNANISGKIKGNIKVSGYLEVSAKANIKGDISAKELSVAKGAIINGNCEMLIKEANNQKINT